MTIKVIKRRPRNKVSYGWYKNIRKLPKRRNNIQIHSYYKFNKNWGSIVRNSIRPNERKVLKKISIIGVGQYNFTALEYMTKQRNRTRQAEIRVKKKCFKSDFRILWFNKYHPKNKNFGKKLYKFIRVA
jgi:hypothetical protein